MNCKSKILCAIALLLPLTVHAQTSVQPAGLGTGTSPYQIDSLPNLYWLSQTPTAWADTFTQTSDIDASTTSTWSGGFPPIGVLNGFTGSYDGNKHSIDHLTIHSTENQVGLFSIIGISGTIKNIGLTNAIVTATGGGSWVGVLAGLNQGTIIGCYATGTDSASYLIGGLVGTNNGIISNSYAAVSVFASGSSVFAGGGLVGANILNININPSQTISNSYQGKRIKNHPVGSIIVIIHCFQ